MAALFLNVLTASLHGSIVIVAVLLLRLVLKKAPGKFVCLLWLLAFLRLLMPFEIQSQLSLQPEPVEIVYQFQSQRPDLDALPVLIQQEQSAAPEQSQPAPATDSVAIPATDLLLPWLWFAVACGFGIYTVVSYLRLKSLVFDAVKIPGGWESDRIETAFILGFARPRIYIPVGMDDDVRRHILAHERAHLEKGDHWYKLLGFVTLAIHWFNPLVWTAYVCLCKDIEMACDERVVQFMELPERKGYAAALLSCSTNRAHYGACPVAFGEVSVKERVKSVLNYKKPSFWISLLGVIAVLFVAFCLLTNPMAKSGEVDFASMSEEEVVAMCEDALRKIAEQETLCLEMDVTSTRKYTFTGTETSRMQHKVYQNGEDFLALRFVDGVIQEGSSIDYQGKTGTYVRDMWVQNDQMLSAINGVVADYSPQRINMISVQTSHGVNDEIIVDLAGTFGNEGRGTWTFQFDRYGNLLKFGRDYTYLPMGAEEPMEEFEEKGTENTVWITPVDMTAEEIDDIISQYGEQMQAA